jgi:tryptophanyl-tRNA synthetase
MLTDPQRARKSDPGDPDSCNVYEFHKLYSDSQTVERINRECRTAEIGCVECKEIMARYLINALEPMREKRLYYETRPTLVDEIIVDGCEKARKVARKTMTEVKAAIKM